MKCDFEQPYLQPHARSGAAADLSHLKAPVGHPSHPADEMLVAKQQNCGV